MNILIHTKRNFFLFGMLLLGYVPSIHAQISKPIDFHTIQTLSNQVIQLGFTETALRLAIQNVETYHLSSTNDTQFTRPQSPIHVGRQNRVLKFDGDWAHIQFELQQDLFLVFDQAFQKGKHYTLIVKGFPTDQTFSFIYSDNTINGSVKTNQVGYLPDSPKFGYVGNYLGDQGKMNIAPTLFELRDSHTHQPVFTGVPTLRAENFQLSGEKVYECNFSAFNQPGSYYLYVPNIGRGHAFEIGTDIFNSVYQTCIRGLFYQRCGTPLYPPYADTRWSHPICHTQDGIIHSSHQLSPLYNGETIDSRIPINGGWHDAGDYGKYVPTAAVSIFYLLTAYELYPTRFPDAVANIPESNNGIPDLLDEVRWEIDWLQNMQAPDGGVYYKVTTTKWPTTLPHEDLATRYIAPKTTFSTAQFAAVMAMAYRHFIPYWPTYAQTCLNKAEKAWLFLEQHPNPIPTKGFSNPQGMGGGEYGDPSGDADDRAWAAAELYKSTGENKYAQAFDKFASQHPPMWGWNTFQHHQQKASWAYATTQFPTDPTYITQYKKAFKLFADEMAHRTEHNIYRNAYRTVPEWIGWGSFAQSTQYAWQLILAHYLLQDPSYLSHAKINLDTQLGNNPQSISYITGIGKTYPLHPLHHPSMHDEAQEPVPGIPVFGPYSRLPSNNPYFIKTKELLFPLGQEVTDPYPILRRYFDINQLVPMSEFTIQEMAQSAATFAFFSSFNTTPRSKPDSLLQKENHLQIDLNPLPGNQKITQKIHMMPGDTVFVQVFVTNFPEAKSIWLDVTFDPKELTFNSNNFVIGNFIPNSIKILTQKEKAMEVGIASLKGTTGKGDGWVATLPFHLSQAFSDSTDLHISIIDFERVLQGQNQSVHAQLFARGPTRFGDFNHDNLVNLQDFSLFVQAFNTSQPLFDLNKDGWVALADFFLFLEVFQQTMSPEHLPMAQ